MDESDDLRGELIALRTCGIAGCTYTSETSQGLGMHKFHVHGIRSKNSHPKKKRIEANPNLAGEDIVLVVLAQLFPAGIPVNKLRLVLDWAASTEQFVDKVRA